MDISDKSLMVAFDHVKRGISARTILEILCFKNGGEPMYREDEVTEFTPYYMEDLDGGISPGDKVKVATVAMINKYSGKILCRATVNKH